jgi:hypothetical protein
VEFSIQDVIDELMKNPYQKTFKEIPKGASKDDFALAAIDSIFDLKLNADEIKQLMMMPEPELREELYELSKQTIAGVSSTAIESFAKRELMLAWQQFLAELPHIYDVAALTEGLQPGTLTTKARPNVAKLLDEIGKDMRYHFIKILFTRVTIQQIPLQQPQIEIIPQQPPSNVMFVSPYGDSTPAYTPPASNNITMMGTYTTPPNEPQK